LDHPATLTVIAIFLWWFFTGAILLAVRWADRHGGGAHGMVVLAGVPFLALGVAGVITSLPGQSVEAVYAGFLGALAIWGWIEMAFLTGIIAGPERRDCPVGLSGMARFWRAWNTVAHHELALTLGLFAIVAMASGAANQVALWTYLILYVARVSAKLNLFFGVPRINLEFIPARLSHLKGYFRRGPVTPAFPIAVTFLTFATGCFIERMMRAEGGVDIAAYTLLAALSALALLEHWLMVVPLPDAKLWRWMLPNPSKSQDPSRKTL
jgi:putative photosynthetic complex assembly protein 2